MKKIKFLRDDKVQFDKLYTAKFDFSDKTRKQMKRICESMYLDLMKLRIDEDYIGIWIYSKNDMRSNSISIEILDHMKQGDKTISPLYEFIKMNI